MNESTKPAVTWSIIKVNKVLYTMILRVLSYQCKYFKISFISDE